MDVLIKALSKCIAVVLTLGLLGCGCLHPYTPNTLQNLYVDFHSDADNLSYLGEYREAVEKYEQAFKLRPRFSKIIDVSYLPLFKYHIAFCYAKLAEAEADDSLYIKAEAAVRESYQTAILQSDQAYILNLWGYILFKQGRYEEASAEYEEAIKIFLQHRQVYHLTDELYALGKVYLALGDETAVRQIFAQLETPDYVRYNIVYRLGKAYLELGDTAAARRVFAQLKTKIDAALQNGFPYIADELYRLGHAYIELGDEASARRTFTQLLKHYPHTSYKPEVKRLLKKK